MKYRRLRKDELAELEKQFVLFLSARALPAADWEKMKDEEPARAEALIEEFSDQVFEATLRNVEYLEHRLPNDLKVFHCGPEKMVLMGLRIDGNQELDFTKNHSPEEMMAIMRESGGQLKMYSAEKTYRKERELELFDLLEMGALISTDGTLFQTLNALRK